MSRWYSVSIGLISVIVMCLGLFMDSCLGIRLVNMMKRVVMFVKEVVKFSVVVGLGVMVSCSKVLK